MFSGIEAFRWIAPGSLTLAYMDFRFHRDHDPFSDLVLQFEYVVQTAVEAVGPKVIAAGCVD